MELSQHCKIKFALVSHVLPPSWSGQAVVLHRLLRALDPDCYCLISLQSYDPQAYKGDMSSRLKARYYCLNPGFRLGILQRFGLSGMRNWLQTYLRARQIFRIVKKDQSDAIIACTGNLYDLPAAYLASRWAGVRYFVYLFDDYFYQWPGPLERSFAQRWERMLIKEAVGVVVPNEFLYEEYRGRYGIEPVVIHNPCEELRKVWEEEGPWPTDPWEIKIVYTGAVYHAHYDAFHNLIAAIPQLKGREIKLHLYTAQEPAELERERIKGAVVYHPHLSLTQIGEVQRRADILFLPLAFVSAIPEVIKTSAPGKMGEYLSSGRPILVHAPADSFLTWYFKKYECGVVVEQNNPAALTQAIQELLRNVALRETLAKNALDCARRDFSPGKAGTEFLRLFQPIREGQSCASSS